MDREVGTGSDLEVSSSASRASGFQVVNGKEKILQQFRDSTHLHGSLPWQERDRYISGLFHLLFGKTGAAHFSVSRPNNIHVDGARTERTVSRR